MWIRTKHAIAALGGLCVLGTVSTANAFGTPFFRPFRPAPVQAAPPTLEECVDRASVNEGNTRWHNSACEDIVYGALFDSSRVSQPSPYASAITSTTAYADSSGEIQTVSDVVEFRPDVASVEHSSVLGSNDIVELVSSTSDFNILNPDANINSCFEYAVALNWDYYQYRASFDDASDSMALFELGMTAAGGDVVTRLANGEMLRNRAYHGLGGSASACANNTRCLQPEDQPTEAFPDYMAASTTGRIVRNAFHILNDAELDAVSARDRSLANALESSMAQTFSGNWAEHRNRYNALRSTDVDILDAHYVARGEFVDLVMQRRDKAAEVGLSSRNPQLRAELDALDDLIADALAAADANGCIGSIQTRASTGRYGGRRYYAAPSTPRYTACDWAPSDFTSQLARQMEVIASGRLSECTSTDLHNGFTHYSTGAAGYENYEYTDCVEIPRLGDVPFNRALPRDTFADETTVEPQLAEISQAYENSLNCEMRSVHLNWTGSDDQEFGLDWCTDATRMPMT